MSWSGYIFGKREAPVAVDILLERLQDSHKIEDRKKTISELKASIESESHAALGRALGVFVGLLKADRSDTDIIRDTLEILIRLTTCSTGKDNSAELNNTEIFVKDPNNVATVLNLLEEKDYYIRYSTTQLVTTLLANKSVGLQDAILLSPMGILRLMDLLSDQRDVIRNEALLLLLELTQTNQEIQKIVAFEGAFEKLLDIIQSEGSSDGGIIVQDCLKLINNLLRSNVSNQNYFRESNCIKRIPPLLEVQNSDMWILTDNKFATLVLTLDLISLLVHGSNPSAYACQYTEWTQTKSGISDQHKNQTVLAQNNVITLVVRLALGKMASATIRSKSLLTLGDLIRGHNDNLAAFAGMSLLNEASKQTQPSLMRLVLVLLNSKDLGERLAALHTFQCYLVSNEEGQLALASTVTPPPTTEEGPEAAPSSIGGYLLRALLGWLSASSPDTVSAWLASNVFSAILKENKDAKELLLRIPLEIPVGPNANLVTLMTKAVRALSQSERVADPLIKVGLLRMLCVWLDESPASVKAFLSTPTNLPFLVEVVLQPAPPPPSPAPHIQGLAAMLIGLCLFNEDETGTEFNKSALYSIIMHRIGSDKYSAKLDALRKTEDFNFAEQGNQDKDPALRYYDYDFTLFYKDALDKIRRILKSPPGSKPSKPKKTTPPSDSTSPPARSTTSEPTAQDRLNQGDTVVLTTYKELVRRLESELSTLREEQHRMQAQQTQHESILAQKDAQMAQLRAEFEARASDPRLSQQPPSANQTDSEEQARILMSLSQAYNQLQERLQVKEDEVANLTKQMSQMGQTPGVQQLFVEDTESASASSLFEDSETANLRKQVATLQEENKALQDKLAAVPAPAPATPPATTGPPPQQLLEDNRRMHEQLTQLSGQYNQLYHQYGQLLAENQRVASTLTALNEENSKLKQQQQQQSNSPQAQHQNTQLQEQLTNQNTQLTTQNTQLTDQNNQLTEQTAQLSAQLQQAQARISSLETTIQEKEKERKNAAAVDNSNLRIAKLEMLLKEGDAKYESLEKEQSDLVQCLTNTEMENINLKERIALLEGKE